MSFSKLRKIHVIIIGSVLCVIAIAASFFFLIKPKREAFAAAKARYDAASPVGNELAKQQAEDDLAKAIAEQGLYQRLLDEEMARRMPRLDFSQRDIGMLALWKEQINNMGPLLERFARDPKVRIVSANFTLPPPPVNPNDPVFSQDVLVFQLGNVVAQGDFKALMNNVSRWNQCPRLVMVSPPQLVGTSPQLQASYSVTCYVFPYAKAGSNLIQIAGGATGQPGATPGSMPSPGYPTAPNPQ